MKLKIKTNQVAPRILRGYGQVRFADALRISIGKSIHNRVAHISTIIWGGAFGLMSAQWAPPTKRVWVVLAAFCIAAIISYSSMFPWRVQLLHKNRPLIIRMIANSILALAVGCLLFFIIILGVSFIIEGEKVFKWQIFQSILLSSIYGIQYPLVGFYITLMADLSHRQQIQFKEIQRFERLAEQSQLTVLRSQINPHFFFNTLNTIAALIPERPTEAERAVELLATALRPVLMREQSKVATLENELFVAKAYTAIEALRLGDRCQFMYIIETGCEQCLLPSLSLQPIFENAVRHGAMLIKGDYKIEFQAWLDRTSILHIMISNMPAQDSTSNTNGEIVELVEGHALHNINERLRILFGNNAKLEMKRFENGRLGICKVSVPQYKNSHKQTKFIRQESTVF